MGNNQFLIPANTKRGNLIFGIFLQIDLIIFSTGVIITFVALIILSNMHAPTWANLLAIMPAALTGFLVIPINNYHNMRVAIKEIINFYSNNRNYIWRGWCIKYESRDK